MICLLATKVLVVAQLLKSPSGTLSSYTANGVTTSSKMVDAWIPELELNADAHVLESYSFSFVSREEACSLRIFHFVWPAGHRPYFAAT
jgi:hypothetical protein